MPSVGTATVAAFHCRHPRSSAARTARAARPGAAAASARAAPPGGAGSLELVVREHHPASVAIWRRIRRSELASSQSPSCLAGTLVESLAAKTEIVEHVSQFASPASGTAACLPHTCRRLRQALRTPPRSEQRRHGEEARPLSYSGHRMRAQFLESSPDLSADGRCNTADSCGLSAPSNLLLTPLTRPGSAPGFKLDSRAEFHADRAKLLPPDRRRRASSL